MNTKMKIVMQEAAIRHAKAQLALAVKVNEINNGASEKVTLTLTPEQANIVAALCVRAPKTHPKPWGIEYEVTSEVQRQIAKQVA
jgi:hypothetical protein